MKRIFMLLAIIVWSVSLWAMSPLSDSDLSDVNNQASLGINHHVMKGTGIGTMVYGDHDGSSTFWQISIDHPSNFDIHIDAEGVASEETTANPSLFSFSSGSQGVEGSYIDIRKHPFVPITMADLTKLDDDLDDHAPRYTISDTTVKMTQSIAYPKGFTGSANENDPVVVDLKPDGHTQLRIYYTGEANFSIKPNSWVDVRTH